jgi:hypothetical protein
MQTTFLIVEHEGKTTLGRPSCRWEDRNKVCFKQIVGPWHDSSHSDTWVHAWVIPCGIYGGYIGIGQDFSPSSLVFRCQYHSTVDLHTQISSGGEKYAPSCLQFGDMVSPRRREHEQEEIMCKQDSSGSWKGLFPGTFEHSN